MAGEGWALVSRFAVGADVTRPINVFQRHSPIRRGVVTRVYTEPGYKELYEVTWHTQAGKPIDPLVCVGYLPHGIDPA